MDIRYYLFLSIALFVIGIIGVLTRRNAIIIFMCIELMLNAVNLLLVAFSKMHHLAAGGASQCRQRRSAVRFLHHGGGCSRSKRGPGHHRDAVPEYAFGGHELFKQTKTLIQKAKVKSQKMSSTHCRASKKRRAVCCRDCLKKGF
jgi:hypothetical protein